MRCVARVVLGRLRGAGGQIPLTVAGIPRGEQNRAVGRFFWAGCGGLSRGKSFVLARFWPSGGQIERNEDSPISKFDPIVGNRSFLACCPFGFAEPGQPEFAFKGGREKRKASQNRPLAGRVGPARWPGGAWCRPAPAALSLRLLCGGGELGNPLRALACRPWPGCWLDGGDSAP